MSEEEINLYTQNVVQSDANAGDLENNYQFFRTLVKRNIFQMTNVNDQRILSTWLHKCDEEEDKSLSCGYITLMLVSLHNSDGHMGLFKYSAPSKLPQLTNTPEFLYKMIGDQLLSVYNLNDDYDNSDKCQKAIHSAVSSDMTSFATTLVDEGCVQVFYARSDRTIDTWDLPDHEQFPVYSRSPTQWERSLSTFPRAIHKSLTVIQKNDQKDGEESKKSPTEISCKDLMVEQFSMGLNIKREFQWYDKSRLDGTLRPINEVCIDKDVCRHEKTQLELDERAINILHKMYPGCVQIVIAPRLIVEVTGKNQHNLNSHKKKLQIDRTGCENILRGAEDARKRDNGLECPAEKDAPQYTMDVWKCRSFEDDLARGHCPVDSERVEIQEQPVMSTACEIVRPRIENRDDVEKSNGPLHGERVKCGCEANGSNWELMRKVQLAAGCNTERVDHQAGYGWGTVENTWSWCSLHGERCRDVETMVPLRANDTRFRAGSDNPGRRCAPGCRNNCCGPRRGRDAAAARGPAIPADRQRMASRIPVPCVRRPERIDRPVQLYERSMLPVPNRRGPVPARIPRPATTHNVPVQQNAGPSDRRSTYDMSQSCAPSTADRRNACDIPQPCAPSTADRRNACDIPQPCAPSVDDQRNSCDRPQPCAPSVTDRRNSCNMSQSCAPSVADQRNSCDRPQPCDPSVTDRRNSCDMPQSCAPSVADRRNTYDVPQPCAPSVADRRNTYDVPQPCAPYAPDRRSTYDMPQPSASSARRGTYDVPHPCTPQCELRNACDSRQDGRAENSSNRVSTAPSFSRVSTSTSVSRFSMPPGDSNGGGSGGGGGGGGGGSGGGGGGGSDSYGSSGGGRNHTFTVSGTIQLDYFPGQAEQRPQLNDHEAIEAYFNNPLLDDSVLVPRPLSVPGCPYVSVNEAASLASTPEQWREMLDNRSSIGSRELSMDISPVFEHTNDFHDESDWPDQSSDLSSSGRPFGLDDSDVIEPHGLQQDVADRRRSRAVSLDHGRSASCPNHRRNTFDRNTR